MVFLLVIDSERSEEAAENEIKGIKTKYRVKVKVLVTSLVTL